MKQKARVWLCVGLLAVNLWGCGENKTEEMAQQENTAAEQEEEMREVFDKILSVMETYKRRETE